VTVKMETCTLSCHVKIKVTLVVKSKTKIGFPPPSTSWPLLLLVAVGLFFVLRREDAPPAPRPADDDEEGEEAPEYDAHNFERRRGIGCCTGVGPGTDRGIVKIDECRHLMRTLADRIGRVGGMSAAVSAFQLAIEGFTGRVFFAYFSLIFHFIISFTFLRTALVSLLSGC